MHLPEPEPSRWELHWRMLGADFRIHPFFWASSAVLGVYYYQHPTDGGWDVFVFWMLIVFVSMLLHELGHVFAARLFGVRGRVYLSGLGGRLLNLAELKRWQRMIVLLAGPLISLSIVGLSQAITFVPLPSFITHHGWNHAIGKLLVILAAANLWWGLLNLLPLWPLDGGQFVVEAAEGLRGPRGTPLAALLCVLVTGLLTAWVCLEMRTRLINPYHSLYRIWLEELAILSFFCFVLWLRAFRLLWGEPQPLDDAGAKGRAA